MTTTPSALEPDVLYYKLFDKLSELDNAIKPREFVNSQVQSDVINNLSYSLLTYFATGYLFNAQNNLELVADYPAWYVNEVNKRTCKATYNNALVLYNIVRNVTYDMVNNDFVNELFDRVDNAIFDMSVLLPNFKQILKLTFCVYNYYKRYSAFINSHLLTASHCIKRRNLNTVDNKLKLLKAGIDLLHIPNNILALNYMISKTKSRNDVDYVYLYARPTCFIDLTQKECFNNSDILDKEFNILSRPYFTHQF